MNRKTSKTTRSDDAPNWDPQPHERRWYTHSGTGDRGYLVRRAWKDVIRYDQPGNERIVPLKDHWVATHEHRPLNVAQLAMVVYAADQELCRVMGLHRERKEWLMLSEEDRAAWIHGEKPEGPQPRLDLHEAAWNALRGLAK